MAVERVSETEDVPLSASGLLAKLEHAVGWELDRRAGVEYRLGRPTEAIAPEEMETCVIATLAMAVPFRHSARRDTRDRRPAEMTAGPLRCAPKAEFRALSVDSTDLLWGYAGSMNPLPAVLSVPRSPAELAQ